MSVHMWNIVLCHYSVKSSAYYDFERKLLCNVLMLVIIRFFFNEAKQKFNNNELKMYQISFFSKNWKQNKPLRSAFLVFM